ncbi:hypothetical protein RJ640_026761 [Escallonia rubra]|uniref:Uncharacterized protein n=1 Tax=Escallonia rubra TaxID=112253 RepID=A0AA88RH23_9ASTE|nr:hypothetical protein RJ640_026761 [Escallonia rubra]
MPIKTRNMGKPNVHLYMKIEVYSNACTPLSTDPASELDVLGHDGDPLGVNGAKIGVLEETHQVSLRRLLQCGHGGALEPEVGLEVLGDLSDQPLEGQLPDQQLGALLVLPYLPQRHRPRPEPVGLLHPSGRRSRLPRRLCRQLLPRSLAAGRLPRRLLGNNKQTGQEPLPPPATPMSQERGATAAAEAGDGSRRMGT